jgi:hypothetical protein
MWISGDTKFLLQFKEKKKESALKFNTTFTFGKFLITDKPAYHYILMFFGKGQLNLKSWKTNLLLKRCYPRNWQ